MQWLFRRQLSSSTTSSAAHRTTEPWQASAHHCAGGVLLFAGVVQAGIRRLVHADRICAVIAVRLRAAFSHLGEQVGVGVEVVVAGRVRPILTDPSVERGARAGCTIPMSVSQSTSMRRRFSGPAASPWATTAKARPGQVLRIAPARQLERLGLTGSLPSSWSESGLPPSAQTSRSIISFKLAGA